MRFTKMHGCGNDYVYVEESELPAGDVSELARKVSDRKKGIGSDGLIVIGSSDMADVRMKMYNADGSVGKMCGNGIRCLSKYVYEHRIVIKTRFRVETDAGIKIVKLECREHEVISVAVNMGAPIINSVDSRYIIGGRQYIITSIDMGNPHAVIFVDDVNRADVKGVGIYLERHASFPEGVNTEFVQPVDGDNIVMRVWERGSGETLACGTGACAAVVAGYINGRCGSKVKVSMSGGSLNIDYDDVSGEVYMQGDAHEVYKGEWLQES